MENKERQKSLVRGDHRRPAGMLPSSYDFLLIPNIHELVNFLPDHCWKMSVHKVSGYSVWDR